jgi:hypothetical protein
MLAACASAQTAGALAAYWGRRHHVLKGFRMSNCIAAHKHRTRLHVLRDRLKRALRDEKRGLTGASERVVAHRAKRSAYRAANPARQPR